jgi:hypothetical protein
VFAAIRFPHVLALGAMLAVVAVASAAPWPPVHRGSGGSSRQAPPPQTVPQEEPSEPPEAAPRGPGRSGDWLVWVVRLLFAALLAGVLAACGVLLARVRPRWRRTPSVPDTEAEDVSLLVDRLARAVADALELLRRERDPRRAVILAYAAMERAFFEHGVPRLVSETPFEYVGRALGEIRLPAPTVRRLTELYERARFSVQTIDAGLRDEAIAALGEVDRELERAA